MRKLLMFVLGLGLVATLPGQGTVVYTDYSPSAVRRLAIGTSQCTVWAKLGPGYDTEIACYTNSKIRTINAAVVGEGLMSSFTTPAGDQISILLSVNNGSINYQIAGIPKGGVSILKTGSF